MHPIERREIRTDKKRENNVASLSSKIENILVKRHASTLIASAVGVIVMVIASLFLYLLSEKNVAIDRVNALRQSTLIQHEIEQLVTQSGFVANNLKSFVVRNKTPSENEFRSISEKISRANPFIQRITWAPAGVIQNVYPLGLNKHLIDNRVSTSAIKDVNYSAQNLVIRFIDEDLARLSMHSLLFSGDIAQINNGLISLEIDLYHFFRSLNLANEPTVQPFIIKELDSERNVFKISEKDNFEALCFEATQFYFAGLSWEIQTLVKSENLSSFIFSCFLAGLFSVVLSLVSYRFMCSYSRRSVDAKAGAYRANFDLLTGLPNRYHFSLRLKETIDEAQREQTDFAVCFMDIDHFKQMNDALGHGKGDAILTAFAARLKLVAKCNDLIARVSGDEFFFVAREVDDVIKADLLAEKLKKHLQQPIEFAGQQHFITVSMGVAMYPIDGVDVASLLHHSDQAMYAAKRAGRNRHFFFNEAMREQADSYLNIHQDILRGLAGGEFELYYQPMLNVKSESVDFCEALVRWNHPERGLVMPGEFIRIAERTGAIREIGNWAFSQACRDIREFIDSDIHIKIALNHSISEYYSNRAFESWKQILKENAVTGDNFIFEIPEAMLMDKKSIRMSVVTAMRKMGVQFAIDDFGTGHSAINYLRNYPADILKIDSSLIQGMQESSKDRTLVEVVLTLAKSLDKIVVAEGVENANVAEHLKGLNCDYLQGNWLLEPRSINRLIPYIHQHMFELEERTLESRSSLNR
ncbi:MAG: bifunctional diguanylate cyclase/phosphodiesterase [Oceanospirillaceae bacterium]